MYIKRQIEKEILKASRNFPVLLLTGPRQVGKSRTLNEIKEENRQYITLDDPIIRNLAINSPEQFLKLYRPPLIIDEIQYAPNLFNYIKIEVDKYNEDGMYWLTGSQVFSLMRGVQESLAGRVRILRLQGISQQEEYGEDYKSLILQEDDLYKSIESKISTLDERILRGSFPRLITHEELLPKDFYASYIQTWLERDVSELSNLQDTGLFFRFCQLLATRTAQELNKTELAKSIQVDAKTIERWLNILETSGIIYMLPAWSKNLGKRIIKRPKVYFLDTGLCLYLAGIYDVDSLKNSIIYGSIFETFVIVEILKSNFYNGDIPRMYYYRDSNQKEIDLIIDYGEKIYPFEIKSSEIININKALKNFDVLEKVKEKIKFGGVIYKDKKTIPIDNKFWFISVDRI